MCQEHIKLSLIHIFKVFSGNSIERVVDMAIDSDDNIIVLGYYSDSIDFDPGPDTLQPTTSDMNNIFIEKLTSEGDLIWVKTIGEAGYERPESIEVDYNGCLLYTSRCV